MKIKHIVIGLLVVGTGVGFAIATKKTNGGKGTVNGSDYRVQILPHRDGGYFGLVFLNGQEQEATIGPMDTVDALEAEIAKYMAGLDVVAFYTVHTDANGSYYFDGWSRGAKITTNGPYASEQLANQAGSAWAAKTAAVPMPSAA